MYFDSIKVSIRVGEIKNQLTLFELKDNTHQRGYLGLGTQGNDDLYISKVIVEPFDPDDNDKEKQFIARNFDNILKQNTKQHKEKFCKFKYDTYEKRIECKDYHNYCKIQCDSLIHPRESGLNFICYNKCVKDSILKMKLNNIKVDALTTQHNNLWIPKINEKCDFKPDDEELSYWVNCSVKNVKQNENDPEQKIIELQYDYKGMTRIGSILYPNSTLKKCGEILNTRKDCLK